MFTLLLTLGLMTAPHSLRTDLINDTQTAYSGGVPTSATLSQVKEAWRRGQSGLYQVADIHSAHPNLGWELPDGMTAQTAYRVLMATSVSLLEEGKADVWDSSIVEDSRSVGITAAGKDLEPATIYYWTVKVRGDGGEFSPYAESQTFLTAPQLDEAFPRLPLRKTEQEPISLTERGQGHWTGDFGKAAFGQLRLTVESTKADTLTVLLGEATKDGGVDPKPGGSIRFTSYQLPVHPGRDVYQLAFKPDGRNAMIKPQGTDVRPVLMPDYIGEVFPFRYVEVKGKVAQLKSIERQAVHYAWDDEASYFHSSDTILNQVWDLCKYSIKATSFAGVYVDGDRERIPYEADAIINQLGHYGTDHEYTMARYTTDYLCHNATWPTEWILQAPLLAWNDYFYTGDTKLIERDYDILKARTLTALEEENGLISTKTGRQTTELLRACGYFGKEIRDIVDWPQSGALGIGKEEPGEADGYVLEEYNTVVNAFHYEALRVMSLMAKAVNKPEDAAWFEQKANRVRDAVNTLLFDKKNAWYRDGLKTEHHSLHASMFPVAFGMVPEKYLPRVLEHIKSRGMACSVYGAQFLMEALYRGGLDHYALSLLTDVGSRSWYNMIRKGSTVSWEAWDAQFKPNLDWNHAWGAAPANVIPRLLMGIEPLEPGWSCLRIQPRPGQLREAEVRVPTIKGAVTESFKYEGDEFVLQVKIPYGCKAQVILPYGKVKDRVKEVSGGPHTFRVQVPRLMK